MVPAVELMELRIGDHNSAEHRANEGEFIKMSGSVPIVGEQTLACDGICPIEYKFDEDSKLDVVTVLHEHFSGDKQQPTPLQMLLTSVEVGVTLHIAQVQLV